ncbi:MAG: glycosyltransferase family protein [Bacteroidetes bacterium]|nr:glycosyltransferase family protein [Bacteroidota bacterium]
MSKKKIIVFIQARIGSTRFPAKVLKKVLGKELLLHMYDRVRQAKTVDDVVIITSVNPENDLIVELCKKNSIKYYRGSEEDLLDRHYQAAKKFGADFIVKIPSDSPMADPAIIDKVLSLWITDNDKFDYVSNYHPPTFPDGLDVEGCSFSILKIAWIEAKKPFEREHTFPFIWDNIKRFRIGNIENPHGNMFMTHRWTLDYEEDYKFMKRVFEELKDKPDFSMEDILNLLNKNPEIELINRMHTGINWYRKHEGELKTVTKDQYYKNEQHP